DFHVTGLQTCALPILHRALELAPSDSYANDFLGTVYFLQGNLDAALKYWNRVGKPQIAEIRAEPTPRLDSVLLDRAFAFSPASRSEERRVGKGCRARG